jgi:hypothetical protein
MHIYKKTNDIFDNLMYSLEMYFFKKEEHKKRSLLRAYRISSLRRLDTFREAQVDE